MDSLWLGRYAFIEQLHSSTLIEAVLRSYSPFLVTAANGQGSGFAERHILPFYGLLAGRELSDLRSLHSYSWKWPH
jgi:hypothetical protein